MKPLLAHEEHQVLGAEFAEWNGFEVVARYRGSDPEGEYRALWEAAGVLDLSFRGRICLTGSDRVRFLHGQVTNDIQGLGMGQGRLAGLVSGKGRFESELHVYALKDELLLDFEAGQTTGILERFERFIIADDVQAVDVAPFYGLLSVQGPEAAAALSAALGGMAGFSLPLVECAYVAAPHSAGDIYIMKRSRVRAGGFDVYVPQDAWIEIWRLVVAAAQRGKGAVCGMEALERVRIESGIPRFGVDLDASNLAPEAGDAWVARGISYSKGCYIGQEVIARIRTYGQVVRALRGLRFLANPPGKPLRGDGLFVAGKEVGKITSATHSPRLGGHVALGMVRKECNAIGTRLTAKVGGVEVPVEIVPIPFERGAGGNVG